MNIFDRFKKKNKKATAPWPPKHAGQPSASGKYDTGGLKAESGSNNNNRPMGNYGPSSTTGEGGVSS